MCPGEFSYHWWALCWSPSFVQGRSGEDTFLARFLFAGQRAGGRGPLLLFPEILPFKCAYNFCSFTYRCLIWLSVPPSLNRWCKGTQLSLTLFACICLGCGTQGRDVILMARRVWCFLKPMLPLHVIHVGSFQWIRRLPAFLLLPKVMFHDLWKTSWNKKSIANNLDKTALS